MPRKVEIPQSADTDYTDDDLYEITYTDGKSTRNNVMEQKISNLQIRVNDVFVMQKWMFLLNGFILVILISLIILFATNSSSGDSDVTATTLPSSPPTSASTTPPSACEDGWIDGRSVDLGCLFGCESSPISRNVCALVSPLVRPLVRKRNLDHIYAGLYAS